MRRLEREENTGIVGDTLATDKMLEYTDIVDKCDNRIVGDTPATDAISVVMNIVDSMCMRIVGDMPATGDTPRDIIDVGRSYMHVCAIMFMRMFSRT